MKLSEKKLRKVIRKEIKSQLNEETFEDLPDAAQNLLANMGLRAGDVHVLHLQGGYHIEVEGEVNMSRGDLMRAGKYAKDGELLEIGYRRDGFYVIFSEGR